MRIAAAAIGCMILLLTLVQTNSGMTNYLTFLKQTKTAGITDQVQSANAERWDEAKLREHLTAVANERNIPPVDARVDRVWKAIPGYNGLELDMEKTVQQAAESPSSEPLIYYYKQIPPKIGLDQLGPQPIYRGNENKPMVAIMINVAWGNEYLEAILETLDREKVKSTFFLDGTWLKNNVELAKKIKAQGHELSNHAYSHPNMSQLGRQAAYAQIAKTENLLKEKLEVNNKWFAPPSGDYNLMTVQVASQLGLKTVLWTIDTVDWMKPTPSSIVSKIKAKLEPGALILMHPTASSRDALPGMIAAARSRGYAIDTVTSTLSSDRVTPSVEGRP
ncbi:polysaccharide deacetylase family protein [Paenibacillus sp. GCM10023252]|uniref:polysaccharide deacetylase family protein n=1 Tax=Paenibacillus sp. GCM10023252 TaxID=3252649 RepID=UPI0036202612